jgi:predicted amidohydrolase
MRTVRQEDTKLRVTAIQAGTEHCASINPGVEANFSLLGELARGAAAEQTDLIVFPEYAISGWPYLKGEAINELAEAIPGEGLWYGRYARLARELRTALLCWLVERDGEKLYNTAFLLEKDGSFAGKYRKVQANLNEQTLWPIRSRLWIFGDSSSVSVFARICGSRKRCSAKACWEPI